MRDQTSCDDIDTLNAFRDMICVIAEEATMRLNHGVLLGLETKWIDNLVNTKGCIHNVTQTHEVHYSFLILDAWSRVPIAWKGLICWTPCSVILWWWHIPSYKRMMQMELSGICLALHEWMGACSKLQRLLNLLLHFCSGLKPINLQQCRGGQSIHLVIWCIGGLAILPQMCTHWKTYNLLWQTFCGVWKWH